MKKTMLTFALLLGAPLAAQSWEAGVFLGQQQYQSPHGDLYGSTIQYSPENKTIYAVRLGYSVVDFGPALLQLTAGYQPESTTTMKLTVGGAPAAEGDLKQSYWSVGGMLNFKAVLALGIGLEYRSEDLSTVTRSTTYGRPWVRANAGYAIPSPIVKPFFGVEVAFPLTSKSSNLDVLNTSPEDALKAVAPKSQFGIYAGIRF